MLLHPRSSHEPGKAVSHPSCSEIPLHLALTLRFSNGSKGPEWARPISIGNDCWIGGSVVILGGCSIGDGSTIGAGAVVTKNVPPRQFWAGNPARFIKNVDEMEDQFGPKA